ncbi:MAG: glycosyl transferase, partial [Desulfocurvus sp.]|nr:glycosyl transferase [Desulfocurvus sp.]
MDRPFLRADLHVHSKHSRRPSEWVLRKIGAAESYTEPLRLYETARRRGMDLVTITDHNTLGGSLDIAHLPNTFLSEEITTYLPDNGCKLHVLAWNLTEAQHDDITRARDNVCELVDYLLAQGIPHALAHPMFDMNLR